MFSSGGRGVGADGKKNAVFQQFYLSQQLGHLKHRPARGRVSRLTAFPLLHRHRRVPTPQNTPWGAGRAITDTVLTYRKNGPSPPASGTPPPSTNTHTRACPYLPVASADPSCLQRQWAAFRRGRGAGAAGGAREGADPPRTGASPGQRRSRRLPLSPPPSRAGPRARPRPRRSPAGPSAARPHPAGPVRAEGEGPTPPDRPPEEQAQRWFLSS